MKNIKKIAFCLGLVLLIGSCKKSEDLSKAVVGLGGDKWEKGTIDKYIADNFTGPYNIEVKYKWDRSEFNLTKDIVPIKEEMVIPAMDAVKRIWIEPYVDIAGETFIKKYSHKQFVLAGSAEYNSNGTITLGTAEGGRKVVLFVLNQFDKNNAPEIKRMLKTIHHEYGHILNQNIMFTPDYAKITPADYTATWFNFTDDVAYPLGFITSYARAAPGEDFVEMVAVMLTNGKLGYEAIVRAQTVAAQAKLRAKEAIVVNYYKQSWGIDFYRLRDRTQYAINNYSTPALLTTYLGFNKPFTNININPANTPGMSADYIAAVEAVKARFISDLGGSDVLDDISLHFGGIAGTSATKAVLRLTTHDGAGGPYLSDFVFNVTTNATTGRIAFTTMDTPLPTSNAGFYAPYVTALTNYFVNTAFNSGNFYSADKKTEYGGLTKVANSSSFTFGLVN
ncbi:substrate import-associated zinc metallohydrolase lipoprotein [Pedobacter steynii]|uniref:Substrate import-associated zinc metallohydrolase lipoprotein n=1 Tax=Pedobacter steynii TaxID=430522 RepID=A0A1H0FKB0_9SPHI|nr:putative zinc-binding metallopeptidase [Pedobacter steynii]SDN95103.1 substrate import-associated zinc metallohydrolase lipoprotein [Pedobacter steynii]